VELLLPPNRALNPRFAPGSSGHVLAHSPTKLARVHVPNSPSTESTHNSPPGGHSQLTTLVVYNSTPNQQAHPIPITSPLLSPASTSGASSCSDFLVALIGKSLLVNFQLNQISSSLMLSTVPTLNNLQLQFSNKVWPLPPSSPAPMFTINETASESSSSLVTSSLKTHFPPAATVSPFIEPILTAMLTTYSRNLISPSLTKPSKYP
jgi:hypothetical protein